MLWREFHCVVTCLKWFFHDDVPRPQVVMGITRFAQTVILSYHVLMVIVNHWLPFVSIFSVCWRIILECTILVNVWKVSRQCQHHLYAIAVSLLCYCSITVVSLLSHCNVTGVFIVAPLQYHWNVTSVSLLCHFFLSVVSLLCHWNITSI